MLGPFMTTLLVGVAFGIAGVASYLDFRRGITRARLTLKVAAACAIGFNLASIIRSVSEKAISEALQQSYSATILLATLIGLVALGAHLSRRLRGLDGFLFLFAMVVQLASLTVIDKGRVTTSDRPWFVSHSLAFAVSGAMFIAGGMAGVAYLLVHRMLRRKSGFGLIGRVASLESLERFGRWTPILGFPFFTYGILTGFCGISSHEEIRESRWYVDPTFLFAMVTWLVYAYLCYGSLYRPQLRGRRAAVLATYGLGLVVMVFLFWGFVSPVHQW